MTTTLDSTVDLDLAQLTRNTDPSTRLDARTSARTAGIVALGGVALSVVGSVLNQVVPSVDIFAAMETSSTAEQARLLTATAGEQTPLVAGFAIWMVAFPMAALESVLLSRLGRPSPLTALIRQAAAASTGAIIVFLALFITFVTVIAPAHVAGEDVSTLAETIGFAATTMDWVVTAIVLGLAPVAAVYLGRGLWAPRWLQAVAAGTAVVTVVEIAALITDTRGLAIVLVPVGLLLHTCAGVCALRRAGA
jgi:hypothetical protein